MNDSPTDVTVPEGLDPRVRHRDVFVEADAIHLEKMRHQAQVRDFTIISDEPESLGGENQSPYPLDYLAAGVEAAMAEPVEITASAQLNGEALDLQRHPKRPPRRGQTGGAA